MTARRLALLLAILAAALTISYLSTDDKAGLLGRFGIGPPPK